MKKSPNELKLAKYIRDIQSCKIPAGSLVKLSIERYVNDLKSKKYYFNPTIYNHCCNFISRMKHYTGSHKGKPFVMEGWQLFIIANIVALYIKGTNKRKYNYSYIQVARKNGKTFLASALSLYYLIADNEHSAEVILAANTFQQS